MLLEVRDVRQTDSSVHAGQIPYREDTGPVQAVLFDLDRNLLMIFYPSEMAIYTYDQDLKFHTEKAVANKMVRSYRNSICSIQELKTNVSRNNIRVILPGSDERYSLSLFTLQGRNISEINNISNKTVDLPGMARGVYLLRVRSQRNQFTRPVIVR
jgi:hypothetical protein